jgi:hypothetical protein
LDLLGTVPALEDYAAIRDQADVPEAMIDAMLKNEAFVERMVRWHRDLLWANVDNVDIVNYQAYTYPTYPGYLYWRYISGFLYRGAPVPCLDTPATFGPGGEINFVLDGEGYRREGYVWVAPYWAPDTQIKVCAYDAQDRLTGFSGIACGTQDAFSDPSCGCGPNMRWCRTYNDYSTVQQGFVKDVERRVAKVIRDGLPYTELFTSRRAYVNGPMVHFYRYLTEMPGNVTVQPVSMYTDRLPDLAHVEKERFEEIELPDDHAGILTSPAYLLRFQTNRARAAHFYSSFLCSPLHPPPGGLPFLDPNQRPEPDLQKRDGCKYCHALLEPTGAYWGRWTERGAGYLDPIDYPATRSDCEACGRQGYGCSYDCSLYYVTRAFSSAEDRYLGSLNAYLFRRDDHLHHIDGGPKLLVLSTIVDDRFPHCVARRASEKLLGREVLPEEEPWLAELARRFVRSGYHYDQLVKSIVTSDGYRRVR